MQCIPRLLRGAADMPAVHGRCVLPCTVLPGDLRALVRLRLRYRAVRAVACRCLPAAALEFSDSVERSAADAPTTCPAASWLLVFWADCRRFSAAFPAPLPPHSLLTLGALRRLDSGASSVALVFAPCSLLPASSLLYSIPSTVLCWMPPFWVGFFCLAGCLFAYAPPAAFFAACDACRFTVDIRAWDVPGTVSSARTLRCGMLSRHASMLLFSARGCSVWILTLLVAQDWVGTCLPLHACLLPLLHLLWLQTLLDAC